MVTVIDLDPEICRQRHVAGLIIKSIESKGYSANWYLGSSALYKGNILRGKRKGLLGIILSDKELFHFDYDEKTFTITVKAYNSKDLEDKVSIINEIFNVEGVEVVIKKDFCER